MLDRGRKIAMYDVQYNKYNKSSENNYYIVREVDRVFLYPIHELGNKKKIKLDHFVKNK